MTRGGTTRGRSTGGGDDLVEDGHCLGMMTTVGGDATAPCKSDALIRGKRSVPVSNDARKVHEQDLAIVGGDASAALLLVEPADRPRALHVP